MSNNDLELTKQYDGRRPTAIISNTPSGAPTRTADKRVDFVARASLAIETHNVEAMEALIVEAGDGYAETVKRLRKALA